MHLLHPKTLKRKSLPDHNTHFNFVALLAVKLLAVAFPAIDPSSFGKIPILVKNCASHAGALSVFQVQKNHPFVLAEKTSTCFWRYCVTFCLSASSFSKASNEFSPSGQVPLAPGERLYLLSKRAPSLRPLRYWAQSVNAPLHSPIMVGWVEVATLALMFRSTWSRCFYLKR